MNTDESASTRDAVEILDRIYGRDDPDWQQKVAREELNVRVGQMVYQLREEAGLTQAQLAKRIAATQAMISKVENADYEGSSLEVLGRTCLALGKRLELGYSEEKSAA